MILPRYIRLRDAPDYLGMDKNRFNEFVRPTLIEIPIGIQGIAFDRLDLDEWADEYKKQQGRKSTSWQKETTARKHLASTREARFGTSVNEFSDEKLQAALKRATSKKRKQF